MIIILDANIVFSSILKPKSAIAGILLEPDNGLIFVSPAFLQAEIYKHVPRLCELTGFGEHRVQELIALIFGKILFYPNEVVPDNIQNLANEICNPVDPKDSIYIAFSIYFQSKIWSGDKKLISGLKERGYDLILDTLEILQIIRSLN